MAAASWNLPTSTEIDGVEYNINADYRDILEIIEYLQTEEDVSLASAIALALFYDDFDAMSPEHWEAAAKYLSDFINCFEEDDGTPQPRNFDWEQDYNMIVADINKVAGREIRSEPFIHWFTFIGWFYSVGEGQLSTIVSIRSKLRNNQKLDKWEADFYRNNKSKVDLKNRYSKEEQDEMDRLNALLDRR